MKNTVFENLGGGKAAPLAQNYRWVDPLQPAMRRVCPTANSLFRKKRASANHLPSFISPSS